MLRKRKYKVLFLFWHLNYGGAELGLLTTLSNIHRKRFRCLIVCIEKKGPIGVEIEKLGFEVIYLNHKARLFNLLPLVKIIRIIHKYGPDILHSSLFYANFYSRIATLLKRTPIIITEERSMYYEKRLYHIWIDRILSRLTDKIVVCSRSVLEFTKQQEKIPEEKFYLIYNAVDEKRFAVHKTKTELRNKYGFLNNEFIVGTVGSVIPKKGHLFLIKAAESFCYQIPHCKVLIIGDGDSKEQLKNMAVVKRLSPFFTFINATKDIPELMKIMDIFVLPSLQEGFPRVLVEAMYMGLPVIASSISGIPEIVLDGETGILVPPGDSEYICQNVLTLYRNRDLAQKMAARARQQIEAKFTSRDYTNKLEGLYEELLSSKIGTE